MRPVLGAHVQNWNNNALSLALEAGGIVKTMSASPEPIAAILTKWPGTIVVGRKYFDLDEQQRFINDGSDGGKRCANIVADYFAAIGTLCEERGGQLLIEAVNEPPLRPYDTAPTALAVFSQGFAEMAVRRNLRPVLLNLSVGQPEGLIDERRYIWSQLAPALYAARQYGGVVGLHAYGCPTMQTASEYYTLRYQVDRRLFWPEDLHDLPIFLGEVGIDAGILNPAPPSSAAGWRSYATAGQYADQLRWYRDELVKDPYIIGATPFTGGPEGTWNNFSTDGVPEIAEVFREQRTIKEVPMPYKVTFPNGVPDAVLGQIFEVDVAIVDEATGQIVPISGLGMAYLDVPLRDGGYTYGAIQQVAIDGELEGPDADGRQHYRFLIPENALPPELNEGQGTLRAELISAPFTNLPSLTVPVTYRRGVSAPPAPQPGPITPEPVDWTTSPDRPLMDNLYLDANALEIEGTTEQAQEVGHRVVRLIDWWKSGPNGVDPFFK